MNNTTTLEQSVIKEVASLFGDIDALKQMLSLARKLKREKRTKVIEQADADDCISKEEIIDILNLADQLKYELKHNIPHPHLKGKTLGMIFQKASTRTRVSFETGMYQLGGYPLFLSANDLQIGRGEPVQDTARVLSRYLDGIMIRTFEQKAVMVKLMAD